MYQPTHRRPEVDIDPELAEGPIEVETQMPFTKDA
jgi:hypothetical protein